ncbi:hypothetical protein QA645_33660 [Bradyrhizobium sp. CIAT3101]|uniref:hypothetical protein n=1 Tax=Bradyrhizobium sp. CIAT3101 TaxID=439387 RepID=UPI0024B0DDF3|nr:hypothetical protein [Bradyrhizobium sp. CIAT3101]WFU79404.1 hypothetical protein QA645_33660 [Bradyrhizobium sp. CIAT3101]
MEQPDIGLLPGFKAKPRSRRVLQEDIEVDARTDEMDLCCRPDQFDPPALDFSEMNFGFAIKPRRSHEVSGGNRLGPLCVERPVVDAFRNTDPLQRIVLSIRPQGPPFPQKSVAIPFASLDRTKS